MGYRKIGFRALWLRRLGFRGEYVFEEYTGRGLFAFRRERGREGQECCERAYCIPVRLRPSERVVVWFWNFLRVERSRGSERINWCKSERKFKVRERPEDLVVIADRVLKL